MSYTLGNGYIDLPSGYRWSSAGSSYRSGDSAYIKLPSGIIIQIGVSTTTSAGSVNGSITFPTSFPSACYGVYLVEGGAYGWGQAGGSCTSYAVNNFTTSGATFSGAWNTSSSSYFASGLGCYWMAIGK